MNKYVIELRPDCKVVQEICESDGKVSIGAKSINYLDEFTIDYIKENCKSLLDAFYWKGFEDGKVVNDKGCEGCKYSGTPQGDSPCFNCSNYYTNNWTAKDDKFKFGDEIIDLNGVKGCVVSKDNEGLDTMYALFDGCRVPQYVTQSNYRKTGKHYDIEKLLEEIAT